MKKKKKDKISSKDLSKSSKHLSFISFQTHQRMYVGTIFQITALLGLPAVHQHANKSRTFRGITQDRPKQEKIALHIAYETSQWRKHQKYL
jgi:hypothetical protein